MTRMFVAVIAVTMSLPQAFIALVLIPKMVEIFHELGVRPLPSLTVVVLQGRWIFVGFAFAWSLGAWSAVRRRGSTRHFFAVLLVPLIPIVLTTVGLILPLLPYSRTLTPP
jgi:hypothetical protein